MTVGADKLLKTVTSKVIRLIRDKKITAEVFKTKNIFGTDLVPFNPIKAC